MRAIQRFKALRSHRPRAGIADIVDATGKPFDAKQEKARAEEVEALIEQRRHFIKQRESTDPGKLVLSTHDSRNAEPQLLGIGAGARDPFSREQDSSPDVVSDSPTAVDFNVYETAYSEELERIKSRSSKEKPTTYLTRFVRGSNRDHGEEHIIGPSAATSSPDPEQTGESQSISGKLAAAVSKITEKGGSGLQ